MRNRMLSILALAFIALVILQSLLGGVLFWRTIGLGTDQILAHYHDKSFHGLLEVMLPHTLFIAVALVATLHFLAFVETLSETAKKSAAHLLFALFILDQTSPLFITLGFPPFAYVKMAAFIGFELALGWVWMLVFRYTLKEMG